MDGTSSYNIESNLEKRVGEFCVAPTAYFEEEQLDTMNKKDESMENII